MSVLPPTQCESSVRDYFKMITMYSIAVGKSIYDDDIRAKFIAGLTLSNKQEAIKFGIEKPLIEIVIHLENPSPPPPYSE